MTDPVTRETSESFLIRRLERVLGKGLNQSDVDFLHVLARPDVIELTFEFLVDADHKVTLT